MNESPRLRSTVGLGALLIAQTCGIGIARGELLSERPLLSLGAMEPGTDCRWMPPDLPDLRMNPHYITGPAAGQDRDVWLRSLRAYRDWIRGEDGRDVLQFDCRGKPAWARMLREVAKALDLQEGQSLAVVLEARWLSGGNELCIGLEGFDPELNSRLDWSDAKTTVTVPRDGQYHRLALSIRVPPQENSKGCWRPVLGLDGGSDGGSAVIRVRALSLGSGDPVRMRGANQAEAARPRRRLDRAIYDRPDLAWAARGPTCCFAFMYDRGFYDPENNRYRIDEFLAEGDREWGGYDSILIWQGYPRLGVDPRNQFDMYRDMPGGLAGLRELVRTAHARNVRVFIDYNPWDTGTRREPRSDEESLADLVGVIEADGVFLDTMRASPAGLRAAMDRVRPGVALEPEVHPDISELSICSGSWAQWLQDFDTPGLLHLKWIEPRHMQHQIRRWDVSHRGEIESAFFNGSGMMVWENVFGTWNPWTVEDRRLWRRGSAILRQFAAHFTSDRWEPFFPSGRSEVFVHRWPGEGADIFTLLNRGEPLENAALFVARAAGDTEWFDLWNGRKLQSVAEGGSFQVTGSLEGLGCIGAFSRSMVTPALLKFIEQQARLEEQPAGDEERMRLRSVVEPAAARVGGTGVSASPPPGMVLVQGGRFRMRIEHPLRECGCYPEPGTPPEKWKRFIWGERQADQVRHDFETQVESFFIDETEVSNAQYKQFVDATGYRPRHAENFLKHWPDGRMPEELADHPVVYVDIEDAEAYAAWAGKRLPTEAQWHLAAQGSDGRAWPWGNEFDARRCNSTGTRTLAVKSCPDGRSPAGCYHMAGNVWEWTRGVRDDGHTRFAIIRGGSYFHAAGSNWYVKGGPQPCNHHAKFILMWAGLDRCATVGFRCVRDAGD